MFSEEGYLAWPLVVGGALGVTVLWAGISATSGGAAGLFPAGLLMTIGGLYLLWQAALRKPWALLAIMVVGPTLLSLNLRHRDIGDPSLDWPVAMKAVTWLVMFGVVAVNLSCIRRFCGDRVMMAFACLCALIDLSTLYSTAPLVTGVAALAITAYLGFSCLLVASVPERTVTLCLFWALSVICIVSALSAVLVPDIAFGHNETGSLADGHRLAVEQARLQGLFGQPNILARYVSVFAYITLAAAYRGYIRPSIWIPNALLAAGLLFATQSRGTIIAVVLAALLLMPRRYLVFLVALGVIGGGLLTMSGSLPLLLGMLGRGGDADEAVNMAGRGDLWQFVWQLIGQRPLLGYGFNSFEVFAGPLWTGQTQAGVGAHNNFLSVLYSNGVIGMIPFATGFAILLRRWLYEPDPPRDFFVISTLIYGYTEMDVPSFAAVPSQIFFTMIALDGWRRLSSRAAGTQGGGTHAIPVRVQEVPA